VHANKLSAWLVAGSVVVYAGCGGDNLTLPSEGEPAHITVTGSGQSGRVGTQLAAPLVVKVTDTQDRPVAGATVNFTFDDATAGSTTPSSPSTDANGEASSSITLGGRVGELTGRAWVPVPEGTVPVTTPFTVIATSADANGIAAVSGDQQRAQVGTALPQPLVVQVTDGFGNPISNVTVEWSVTGGGSVNASSVLTGDNGQASVTWTLGNTAGEQTALATSQGLAGSPVTFRATATAGNAAQLELVSGDDQSAPAGTELGQPLVVRLRDADGNPIPNRPVSWVVGSGGGTATPATSNTDAQGLASTRWTLGTTPGANTLNAVVSGLGLSPVPFSATGTGTGSPSTLALSTQPPSSVTVGAVLDPNPIVQIKDGSGNDVALAGVEVTVGKSSGSGRLEGTETRTTDANGRAQFTDLRITGATGSHRLIFAADGYRSVTSNRIDVTRASTTTTITAHDPNPSISGETVTVRFTVTSAAGTPTGRVDVTASGGTGSCHAEVAEGSCELRLVATGERTLTATYAGDNLFATSQGTASHTVNEQTPQPNRAPVAVNDAYTTSAGVGFHVPGANGSSLIFNDTDPDFDDLFTVPTSGAITTTMGGSVTIFNDGSFDYVPPAAPFTGDDTFSYTLTDRPPGEGGLTATGNVTVTIQ
jgi:hypothetical protein